MTKIKVTEIEGQRITLQNKEKNSNGCFVNINNISEYQHKWTLFMLDAVLVFISMLICRFCVLQGDSGGPLVANGVQHMLDMAGTSQFCDDGTTIAVDVADPKVMEFLKTYAEYNK